MLKRLIATIRARLSGGSGRKWTAIVASIVSLVAAAAFAASPSAVSTVIYTYTFDPNGKLVTRIDKQGKTVRYSYDTFERLTLIKYPDGSRVDYAYGRVGRIVAMTDRFGTTHYTYNIHDRIISVDDPNGNRIRYGYDKANRLSRLTYPNGYDVQYHYDQDGRLTALSTRIGRFTYAYDGRNRPIVLSRPNGLETRYSYHGTGDRISVVEHRDTKGVVMAYRYRFDANYNIVEAIREERGKAPVRVRYEYDALDRVVAEIYADRSVRYTYDQLSRRLSVTDSAHGATRYVYGSNGRFWRLGLSACGMSHLRLCGGGSG